MRSRLALALVVASAALGCGGNGGPSGNAVQLRWEGDLVGGGPSIEVSGALPGDVMLAAGQVRFSGSADGSYLGAGQDQRIGGRVGGSVRAAGGRVHLGGEVGRNVTLAGGDVSLEENAVVGRNAYLAGGLVEVLGRVEGSLRVAGGDVVLDGPVTGSVHVESGRLRLGPGARIEGDLRYRTDEGEATIDPVARIEGSVQALAPRPEGGGRTLFRVLRILAFVVTGGVMVALLPGPAREAARTVRYRGAASLGLGLLWLLLVPIVVLVVGVTVVGLPLAVIVAALYAVSLYLGPIAPALWLGDRLLPRHPEGSRAAALTAFAVGGAVLAVLAILPVVGILVRLLVTLAGLGAAALVAREAVSARAAS